jgi:tRNA threonylcarbamoyladenosine biosynthesis protein TsaB
MLVLGIDTSTAVSSVALGGGRGILASATVSRERGHETFLVPAIRFLAVQAGVTLGQVSGVAVGLGPGLFTGLRVGVATAKAMAQALHVPILGIPSLDLLAFGVRHASRLICACVAARRGEVFSAFYRPVPGGVQRLGEFQAATPERLASEIEARGEEVLLVGDGALAYRERLPRPRAEVASASLAHPSAAALIELAVPRFIREEGDSPLALEPIYVRKADAEIAWERHGVVIRRPDRVKIPGRRRGEEGR